MQDTEYGTWGIGIRMQDVGCRTQDAGCRVQDQPMGCRIRIQVGTNLAQDWQMPMALQISRGMSPFCSPSVIWFWYFFTSR